MDEKIRTLGSCRVNFGVQLDGHVSPPLRSNLKHETQAQYD